MKGRSLQRSASRIVVSFVLAVTMASALTPAAAFADESAAPAAEEASDSGTESEDADAASSDVAAQFDTSAMGDSSLNAPQPSEAGEPSADTPPAPAAPTAPAETESAEGAAPLATSGECGENATWSLSGSRLIISGTGAVDRVFTYLVDGVHAIVVEEGITSIGDEAFKNMRSLESVTLPSTLERLGASVFEGDSALESIDLPEGLQAIGADCFQHCSGLTSVELPGTVTEYGDGVFSANGFRMSLTSVTFRDGATAIGPSMFSGCEELESATLPATLVTIGEHAFSGCEGLSSFPLDHVETVGDYAFSDCIALEDVTFSNLVAIGEHAFTNCPLIAELDFGEGLRTIGAYAFGDIYVQPAEVPAFTEVVLPAGVESVGERAFADLPSLESVAINGCGNLGERAFAECENLVSVTIGACDTMGAYAFDGCDALREVTLGGSGTCAIGERAFSNLENIVALKLLDGVSSIGGSAFSGCGTFTSIRIPDSCTTIGDNAFAGTALESIVVEDCDSIGSRAFDCDSLTSVDIGSCASMARNAFGDCESLTSLSLGGGEGETVVPDRAFADVSTLATLSLREGVSSIGAHAFEGCTGVAAVSIPSTCTTVDESAFDGCTALSSLALAEQGLETIGDYAFRNCPIKGELVLPETLKTVGCAVFYNSAGISSIEFLCSAPQLGDTWDASWDASLSYQGIYPADDPTWTDEVRSDIEGATSWVARAGDGSFEYHSPYKTSTLRLGLSNIAALMDNYIVSQGAAAFEFTVEEAQEAETFEFNVDFPRVGSNVVDIELKDSTGKVVWSDSVEGGQGGSTRFVVPMTLDPGRYVFEMVLRYSGNMYTTQVKATYHDGVWFSDVDYSPSSGAAWMVEWIESAYGAGLMSGDKHLDGKLTGAFNPNGPLTRAQAVLVLYRAITGASANEPNGYDTTGFRDVDRTTYYTNALNWAYANGIVSGGVDAAGNPDGRFRPNDSISRQELALMVWRAAGEPAAKDTSVYEATVDHGSEWQSATPALQWTAEQGVLSGSVLPDGTYLKPGDFTTRGQASKIFVASLDALRDGA